MTKEERAELWSLVSHDSRHAELLSAVKGGWLQESVLELLKYADELEALGAKKCTCQGPSLGAYVRRCLGCGGMSSVPWGNSP